MVNCRVDVSHGERCLHSWVVRDDHLTSTGQELFGKCARLARFQIHVNGGQSRDGGNLVGLLNPHLMKEPMTFSFISRTPDRMATMSPARSSRLYEVFCWTPAMPRSCWRRNEGVRPNDANT